MSDILKTSRYVACIYFTFSIRFFIWIMAKSLSPSLLCSMLLLLLLSFLLLLFCITLLFSPSIYLVLSKLLLSFISHVSLINWGLKLKSIIGSLLLPIKDSLSGCLKSSFQQLLLKDKKKCFWDCLLPLVESNIACFIHLVVFLYFILFISFFVSLFYLYYLCILILFLFMYFSIS